jgi:hypothetical protein
MQENKEIAKLIDKATYEGLEFVILKDLFPVLIELQQLRYKVEYLENELKEQRNKRGVYK